MNSQTQQLTIQSGVIPWRVVDGRVMILLITSTKSGRWGIPKGHLEPFLPAYESAAIEAFEEAGVTGHASHDPIGAFHYRKKNGLYMVELFPMQVESELSVWKDKGRRERRWFNHHKASQQVENEDLARLIRIFRPSELSVG